MKNIVAFLLMMFLFLSNENNKEYFIHENTDNWESLFDGKTLKGWHRYNRKGVKPVWTVKKGVLTFDPNLVPEGDYVHALVTDKIFKSFQLSIEWNISEGGNSGIFWGVQEDENSIKRVQFMILSSLM